MLVPTCAAIALVLAATGAGAPRQASSRAAASSRSAEHAARRAPAAARKAKPARTRLEAARALLAQVKRDPAKRRQRRSWEAAIAALEKAARGRDTAPALLDAARARYALYRYSQVDSDRDAALRLAARAQRAGAADASAFAAAIRKERGDDERPARPARTPAPARPSSPDQGSRVAARPVAPPTTPTPGPTGRPPPPSQEGGGDAQQAVAAAPRASGPRGADEDASGNPDEAADEPSDDAGKGEEAGEADSEASSDPVLESALEKVLAMGNEHPASPTPDDAKVPRGPARVSDVRAWSNSDYTRIAIYLSKPVAFTREDIPAALGRPRRLALDLKPARLGEGLAHRVGDRMVERVRAAQRDADTVRVVLDLAGRDDLAIFSLQDPPRLIVDVGVRAARLESQASAQREREPDPREPALGLHRAIRRVVVDAGHGGHDTGAIGPNRVREKDVTLAMARRLARQLRAKGFEVVLTRDSDRYVPLEERTAIANASHADLFVSLHANAHPRRDRTGLETYVLNVADNRYAARLAARENGLLDDRGQVDEVRRILVDLDVKSSADVSRRLARSVQSELLTGLRSRIGDVRDLGVKSALFYVLLGARMPAVLIETAFISNRTEERRLQSPAFQEEIASGVTRAVERFAAKEARLAAAP